MRLRGHFSVVNVSWTLSYANWQGPLTSVTNDFPAASGNLTFNDLDDSAFIVLTPIADGIPEYIEKFKLSLDGVTGTCYATSIS